MTMLTPGRFIAALKRTPILLDSVLCGVTQERALAARDGDDGWNVVEILCHLRDYEEIFFARAKRIVAEDNPALEYFDHEVLAKERAYSSQDLDTVYRSLLATRQEFIAWLEARDETDWDRPGVHPESGDYTLLQQAMQVPLHDVDHIEQMARVLGLPCGDAIIEPLAKLD